MKKGCQFLLLCGALVLSGCLSIDNFPEEPVPPAEADRYPSDDMFRKCYDSNQNRKDPKCVIVPKD